MSNYLNEVDRKVVAAMLRKFPTSADTAAKLAALGFDKEMVREEFKKAFVENLRNHGDFSL